jgi:hypothetical protein
VKRVHSRAIDKIIVLSATICLAGESYGVPSSQFWGHVRQGHPYIPFLLLAVVGVFALSPFESWSTRALADRSVIMKRQILSVFGKLLEMSSAIKPPLDTGDLALHIWQKRRTLRHPISGVLKRIATYRMSTHPTNRSFTPVKGVGVVGLCWQHNQEVDQDVSELDATLTDEAVYEEYVRVHGKESVMGLGWRDFKKVKHRTAVFATPIRNGRNRFMGCISVDASRGYAVLEKRKLMEEITNLALAVGREDFECT